jgi:hypothetical protein
VGTIGYGLDIVLGLTVVVWDGNVSTGQANAHLVRLAEDLWWPPGPLHLLDLTTAASVAVHDPELVRLLVEPHPPFDLAIVARNDDLSAEVFARAARQVGANVTIHDCVQTACAWLEVDPIATQSMVNAIRDGFLHTRRGTASEY